MIVLIENVAVLAGYGFDDKALPAFLKVAFVLRKVKFLVLKLIHLGAYYIT